MEILQNHQAPPLKAPGKLYFSIIATLTLPLILKSNQLTITGLRVQGRCSRIRALLPANQL